MNASDPDEYYVVNTVLTQRIFDAFLTSRAEVFIFLSSVKASADTVAGVLLENAPPRPSTHYGKSKLQAEEYICSKQLPAGKRLYILRPGMIHGPGNKGNLNLLFKVAIKGIPWPLGAFENKRSFCSIDNLLFVLTELLERKDIPSGIYQVVDNTPLSTNQIMILMNRALGKKNKLLKIPKAVIKATAGIGDILHLPLNSERLKKLTESYVVSNQKLIHALGKPLPVHAEEGMLHTLQSFVVYAE